AGHDSVRRIGGAFPAPGSHPQGRGRRRMAQDSPSESWRRVSAGGDGTSMVLSGEQVERFRRDGYLKFGRVADDGQGEAMRTALDRVIAEELEGRHTEERPPEFAYGHDRKGQEPGASGRAARKIHQFVNIWKVAPEYRETIHNPRITAAVRQLMGVPHVRL